MFPRTTDDTFFNRPPSNAGSSYQMVLEHFMKYPETYELPIPAMSTRNITRPIQLPREPSTPISTNMMHNHFPLFTPVTSSPLQAANAQFASCLMSHIARIPSQPCSIPPVLAANFLRRCFPTDLHLVDFPQALIGLDYLKVLEKRHQREVAAAKRRLGVDNEAVRWDASYISTLPSGTASWLRDMENCQRKVDALYTQIYVGLRRWILINELSIVPFNKHNGLALLNVLYPHMPLTSQPEAPPTPALTASVLAKQRTGFLTYISAIETRGSEVLMPLMNQGIRSTHPGETSGWPSVSSTLDQYIRVVLHVIDEASCLTCREDLELPSLTPPRIERQTPEGQQKRKADSGVSLSGGLPNFSSTGKRTVSKSTPTATASTSRTSAASNTTKKSTLTTQSPNPGNKNKPLPSPPPGATVFTSAATPGASVKNFSRLEKLAFEIRKIKSLHQTTPTREEPGDNKENTTLHHGSIDQGHSRVVSSISTHAKQHGVSTTSPTLETVIAGSEPSRGRTLRTLRSFGDLRSFNSRSRSKSKSRSKSRTRHADTDMDMQEQAFDAEEMLRQRALFEARNSTQE